MSDSDDPVAGTIICCVVVFCAFGLFAAGSIGGCKSGHEIEREAWQKDAIKRGFAEYNTQTGQWQWKQTAEEQSRDE